AKLDQVAVAPNTLIPVVDELLPYAIDNTEII
ncbi:MAG: hypothetical protein RI941_155, partial [Pseudomonadota bacterium]